MTMLKTQWCWRKIGLGIQCGKEMYNYRTTYYIEFLLLFLVISVEFDVRYEEI